MASKSRVTYVALIQLFNLFLFSMIAGVPAQPPPPLAPVPAPPPPLNVFTCVINIANLAVCTPFILVRKLLGISPDSSICCNIVKQIPSNNLQSCLCIAAKASVLGLTVSIPGDIKILLNLCGIPIPIGLGCA
uniref:Putative 14 kDa proline-rich protein DC2.15 n=1 Tax=Wolffia australiana TaxID=161112 RepID=G0YLW9_WOLAU|nr:putative 14 kDa proline-rich protein DC2.15 precursor [Wolffia australiana]